MSGFVKLKLRRDKEEKMRTKKIWLIFFILIFLSFLFGEEIWTQFYDPFYASIWKVEDVIACSDGGYAINGSTYDDDTTVEWGFVIKTDSEGNLEWAEQDIVDFQPNNEGRAIIETDDGGFISSSYWFDSGNLLLNRDYNGNVVDTTLLEDIAINSMCKSNDDNIMLAGHNYVNWQNDEDWPCLIKIDQSSEIIWSKLYEFENYEWGVVDAVIPSLDNGFLLAGRIRDPNTEDAVLVIKTNSVGDTLWTRVLDQTEEDDKAKTIIETENGDILVGGFFEWTSGFLWKLDSEGNTIWLDMGLENCGYGYRAFTKTQNDNIISSFGDLEVNHSLRKFDYEHNVEWTNNLDYPTGAGDKGITTDQDGNIVVALHDATTSVAGIIKLDSNGTAANDDVNELNKEILSNHPNPFNPVTTFSFSLINRGNIQIRIFNSKGQVVTTLKKNNLNRGKQSITWEAHNLASGIYFAQLESNNKIIDTRKVLLLK
jgi:hypothetical protein